MRKTERPAPLRAVFRRAVSLLPFALLLCALIVGWFCFSFLSQPATDAGAAEQGVLDLTGFDPETQVVRITGEWEFYPDQLYAPSDFAAGKTETPSLRSDLENPDAIPYGTYRLTLQTAPNCCALLSGYSIDYGTRVFVNGSEAISVGRVSDDPQQAVPSVNYITFPACADSSGRIELVVQYSNFVHREGGGIHDLYFASADRMEEYQSRILLPVNIVAGALLFTAVCMLLKAALRRDRSALLLAVCCVLFALRDQRFYVAELLPNGYDWLLHYRIYILILYLMPVFLLLLFQNIFPKAGKLWGKLAAAALGVLTGILLFVFPTQDAVEIMDISLLALLALSVCVFGLLLRYFIREKRPGKTDILTLCAFVLLFLGMDAEKLLGSRIPAVTRGGWSPFAMMTFVLLMLLVLSLQDRQTEEALALSRQRELDLQKLNAVSREFTQIVAHEINTPLTVASGYAQMLSRQLRRGEQNPNMAETLDLISSETRRLSALVTQMLVMSKDVRLPQMKERIPVFQLLEDAAAVARPVLQKNGNFLELVCETCPDVAANRDALLQILLNLSDNAGRHTREGRIAFTVRPEGGFVRFRVQDSGSGIPPESLPHLFERGCSPDGRSGIGLAVSRDLVTAFGGKMEIESTGPGGTVVAFTVPVWEA